MIEQMASTSIDQAAKAAAGSQTLMRGLDIVDAVADGAVTLPAIALRLGLTKTTAFRLASALVERRYLSASGRSGYRLGPKLLELGHRAGEQVDLIQTARPFIEALAEATDDTVHLGILSDHQALYLDKVAGRRRINISSRVGERQPLASTGLGKALMLDHAPAYWDERRAAEDGSAADGGSWSSRMAAYAAGGYAFDLEENEDQIRCVAAPVRDATGRIVAAVSVSSAAQYMDDARMQALIDEVRAAADGIAGMLGARPRGARSG